MSETLFERTYRHYKQTSKRKKNVKSVGVATRHKVPQYHWLKTHKEFLRWKKTTEFQKWRKKQFLKQGGTCWYCDEPLIGTRQNIEHVIPKIHGGDNRKSNLVIACWKCNKEKYTTVHSYKVRQANAIKNRKKRGTYHILKQKLQTEEELAYELRQRF